MVTEVDVAVIGGGVVGCAVARELSRYKLDVLVLERAHDVGEGSSKANSGVVHAGFHPRSGSFKGVSCVRGNALFPELCRQLDVPLVNCGGMMVAFNDEGVEKLRQKQERARFNGAGELRIADGEEARQLEPRLSPRVVAALLAPTTCVVSPFQLVLGLAENAQANGVEFRFNSCVERIERRPGGWTLRLSTGDAVRARFVANMAGDAAALLEAQVRPAEYVVRPRLGEFLVFDKQDPQMAVTHVIYQAAETDERGTLLAPTVDGNLLAGPTSVNVRRFGDTASTAEGLDHVWRVARKLVPDLRREDVIRNFAGARTNIVNVPKELKDFVVRMSAPGFVSALGIKNPGMTSAPVLATRAVELLAAEGLELEEDASFEPIRIRPRLLLDEGFADRAVDDGSAVVCRCEHVTAHDVRAVMRGPLPPTTMAGVKRRLRCGMGRCQGAYCEPRIAAILADALGVETHAVIEGERGGRFVQRRVK